MMAYHDIYMQRCFNLARLAQYKTKSNPIVGALLVNENRIIGEGFHQEFGGYHAEVNAINSVQLKDKNLIPKASLYVSLEPCCIEGKTPACTQLILESGIKKVIISSLDPNPAMNGKSLQILKREGVDVVSGVLKEDGNDIIKGFKAHLEKRPYIILKYAQSCDGYFGKRGRQVWISNKYSQLKVHQWRSECDAILIGYETAFIDNPELSTRLVPGNNALRVILDRDLTLPRNLKVWKDDLPTLFVTNKITNEELPFNKDTLNLEFNDDFHNKLMNELFRKDVFSLIIEGGARTIKRFVEKELWDEARVITSDKTLVSGIRSPFLTGRKFFTETIISDSIDYLFRL